MMPDFTPIFILAFIGVAAIGIASLAGLWFVAMFIWSMFAP